MKVGILTFHYASNYGAVMQALGLQTALIELGHDPVFIEYVPKYMRSRMSPFRGWGFRSGTQFLKKFQTRIHEQRRRNGFSTFRKNKLKTSPQLSNRTDLIEYCLSLDAIIVGSDQIWNLHWHQDFDDTYFLGFLPNNSNKSPRRIAYGPCFGDPEQSEKSLQKIKHHLDRFDKIGMRNRFGIETLHKLGFRDIPYVVDPAFFLNKQYPAHSFSNDVVVYAVHGTTATLCANLAKNASDELQQPITQINSEAIINLRLDEIKQIRHATPDEWRHHISNAAFVCSESFHGVVFAMLSGIPFVAACSGLRAHRVRDLLEMYGLSQHLIQQEISKTDFDINIYKTNSYASKLNKDIIHSKLFLKEALS